MEMANNEAVVSESVETVVSAPVKVKKPRGFAAMSPEKRAAISALGGKKAHELGVAHRYTSDEAKLAGRAGGIADHVVRGRGKSVDAE